MPFTKWKHLLQDLSVALEHIGGIDYQTISGNTMTLTCSKQKTCKLIYLQIYIHE